jgi:hypothetical protein
MNFRPLTDTERAIIQRLLGEPFPGRDEAMRQIETCRVRAWHEEHCASLEIEVESDSLIPNSHGYATPLPVEGHVTDADGAPIEILLFHRDGLLTDLEFVVYSERMKGMPQTDDIEITAR